jgi:hypothetical protein
VFDRLFLPLLLSHAYALLLSHAYKDKDGQETAVRASSAVKGAESPRLMHDPEAVPPMQR